MKKTVIPILIAAIILIAAGVFLICLLPKADPVWIADLGYSEDEVYPLAFNRIGRRSCPKIPVSIGGDTFHFIFDTGCGSGLTITKKIEDKIDFTRFRDVEELHRDGSHRGWSTHIRIDGISVCGSSFQDVETNMIDWRMTSSSPYDGLVGLAYFQDRTVTLDYAARKAAVSSRPIDYDALGPEYIVVSMLHTAHGGQRDLPIFEAEYGGEPVCVYIDTGKNYSYVHDHDAPDVGHPDALYTDAVTIGGMDLTLKDIAKARIAQDDDLPYPTMIEFNSDQLWALDLTVTFDLIVQKIIFCRP